MPKLFGTDGIRGVAGEPPLDAATIYAVGRALGEFLQRRRSRGNVLVGEDTRQSSPWVTSYLAGGLQAAGANAVSAGVLPTPGVAYLVRSGDFPAGVVVSASHNPYRDNGIKLIAPTGTKFPDETEAEIEDLIHRLLAEDSEPQAVAPSADLNLLEAYTDWLRSQAGSDLRGLDLVVDCANGAAARVAPALFRSLGAGVTAIHAAPDGQNINADCGALHPEAMRKKVSEVGADLGVAFDGDADRAIFATRTDRIVDGDAVLLIVARWLKQQGKLRGNTVVGTVMSNLGLEVALRPLGLKLARAPVGDRYVFEEMNRLGANLGGEQSGHIIFLDDAPTGDGLLTALKVCSIVRATGQSLDELAAALKPFPQVLVNIPVRERIPFEQLPAVQECIQEASVALGERGRILVRYSGTELLARVMVEAESQADVERWSTHIATSIRKTIGRSEGN
jgi:phosphoglucosamine mutase